MQHFISVSIYGLTLGGVTSENSTNNSNADILSRSSSPWLDPLFSATVSGVRCWLPLSVVPRQLSLLSSRQLPLSSFSQPIFFRVPLPLPDPARFQVQKILCLVLRQNRQRNRLLWRTTHIVQQWHRVTVNVRVMAMKDYSILLKFGELGNHHKNTLFYVGSLTPPQETQSEYSKPHRCNNMLSFNSFI